MSGKGRDGDLTEFVNLRKRIAEAPRSDMLGHTEPVRGEHAESQSIGQWRKASQRHGGTPQSSECILVHFSMECSFGGARVSLTAVARGTEPSGNIEAIT